MRKRIMWNCRVVATATTTRILPGSPRAKIRLNPIIFNTENNIRTVIAETDISSLSFFSEAKVSCGQRTVEIYLNSIFLKTGGTV